MAFRLGKVAEDTEEEKISHPRPLKVIFQDVDQAQLLLSLRSKLANLMPGVFFSARLRTMGETEDEKSHDSDGRTEVTGRKNLFIVNGEIVMKKRPFLWLTPLVLTVGGNHKKWGFKLLLCQS